MTTVIIIQKGEIVEMGVAVVKQMDELYGRTPTAYSHAR